MSEKCRQGTPPQGGAGDPGEERGAGTVDLPAVRARLSAARGGDYWRSLEELAGTPAFQRLLRDEFPRQAGEWPDACDAWDGQDGFSRREFLHLLGASLALGGLSACTKQPTEQIAPYVRQPEEIIPGRALYFATAMSLGGLGTGLLVESHEGRPTKVEGNPDHPASLGATDLFSQASVLTLYDPDRSQTLLHNGEVTTWSAFLRCAQEVLAAQRAVRGAGLRLLTETVSSPALASQMRALLADLPAARWHQYEPAAANAAVLGARMAFGADVSTVYRFENADRILAIDADFLSCGPGSLRYTHEFARRRRAAAGGPDNRLYVAETTPSNTGAVADHRLPLRPSEVEGFARAVAAGLGVAQAGPAAPGPHAGLIAALVRDLRQHRGRSLIVVGDPQPPYLHALGHAMNHALGNANAGGTVVYIEPVVASPVDQVASLRELANDLAAGVVDVLVIIGGNPVYTAPVDLRFAERLERCRQRIHLGLYFDETAAACHWHVPEAHYLESWGDTRAYDGTASIVQPLIAPLYQGRSAHELLAAFTDQPERSGHQIVTGYWRGAFADLRLDEQGEEDFDLFWRRALERGVIPGTAARPRAVTPLAFTAPPAPSAAAGLELVLRPDPTVHDGRFYNNTWLQELPKPLTRLAWDNAALISPGTARRLGLSVELGHLGRELLADVVELRFKGRTLRAPIWITPGQPDECVTLTLGYGRTESGRVGPGLGYNAYELRTSDAPWSGTGLGLRKTGGRHVLPSAQIHYTMVGRDLVRSATLTEYQKDPHFAQLEEKAPPRSLTLYPEWKYPGYSWGMAIDLGTCVGCNACVIACQAENNIPVVGRDQFVRGRAMQWLRVDHYYKGPINNPESYFQPVPCMHCEDAPCELVCPVEATLHDAEGLNVQVYNRCVGTRYCSNNCPYKVRRFNFLLYSEDRDPGNLQRNPDVTVRTRGVMEKCTYCIQRIYEAKIISEEEGRRIRDGEMVTACQAACPAEAIVFGDLNDPASRVSRLKAGPRNYALLGELNTRPRTTYLAAVRNPNPAVKGPTAGPGEGPAGPPAEDLYRLNFRPPRGAE